MITIEFTVEGAPVPKGRARVTTRGGFARAYTPAKTREYEDVVKSAGKEAMNGREPLESPLKLFLLFFMPIPKSASKKAKAEMLSGMMKHTKKPDLSNMLKSVEDALNEVCYKDDSQIISVSMRKYYSDTPRVTISIREEF